MAEDNATYIDTIKASMLNLAHVYTGEENGATVTAFTAKKAPGFVVVEINLSGSKLLPEDKKRGIDALHKKLLGAQIEGETQKSDTMLRFVMPDTNRAAGRLSNVVYDAAVEVEAARQANERAASECRLTHILGENGAKAAIKEIDRKLNPRPLTPLEKLASGPMTDWANDICYGGDRSTGRR